MNVPIILTEEQIQQVIETRINELNEQYENDFKRLQSEYDKKYTTLKDELKNKIESLHEKWSKPIYIQNEESQPSYDNTWNEPVKTKGTKTKTKGQKTTWTDKEIEVINLLHKEGKKGKYISAEILKQLGQTKTIQQVNNKIKSLGLTTITK